MKYLLALSLCVVFFPPAPAAAEQKTFTGIEGASWGVDGNWTPGGVPTDSDDVLIGGSGVSIEGTDARAASVTIASTADEKKLIFSGPISSLTTGVLTIGSDVEGTMSGLQFNSTGTLHATSVVMSPGAGASMILLNAAGTLNLSGGSGSITKGTGVGRSLLDIRADVGALGLASSDTVFLVLGQGNANGSLDVRAGQTYAASYVLVGNGEEAQTGTGTLNLNGGAVNAENLQLNAGNSGALNNSAVHLNSGTLTAKSIIRVCDGDSQTFHWNGGTLANAPAGNLTISRGENATKDLVISLAGTGTHTLEARDGWTIRIDPTAILADKDTEHGTLTKAGDGTIDIQSASTYTGGTTDKIKPAR